MNRFFQIHYDSGLPSNYNEYIKYPLVPLMVTLENFLVGNDQLYHHIKLAERYCHHPLDSKLTTDESAAIYLYTKDCGEQSIHYKLNRALRSGNQSMIEPWLLFLKLFNTALEKLPTVKRKIWRGIHIDIAKNLRENQNIIWCAFNSCLLSNKMMTDIDASSIPCLIEALNGKDIRGFSYFIKEDEVLLLPGTRLRVKKNVYDSSVGSHVIHLVEIPNDNNSTSISISNSASSTNKSPNNASGLNNPTQTFVSKKNITANNPLPDGNNSKDDIVFSSTTFAKDEVYEVAYKNGKKQGYGVYFCANGDVKEGRLADMRAKGRGIRTWTNGDRYDGNFADGKRNGSGNFFGANGYLYKGNWMDDKPDGNGASTWENGNRYEGSHKNGKMHGYGKFFSTKGDKYTGDLVDGKAHGRGERKWHNGDRYDGNFKDDKKHGFGMYFFANGGKYTGGWIDDEMTGDGTIEWPSRSWYTGAFKNGKRHGRGKLTFANGRSLYGYWENDKYIG